MVGEPPLRAGVLKGVTGDYRTLIEEFLDLVGWDSKTTVPSEESLSELGLEFLIGELT